MEPEISEKLPDMLRLLGWWCDRRAFSVRLEQAWTEAVHKRSGITEEMDRIEEFLTEVKKPVDAEIRSTVKLLTWDELFNLEEDLRQLMELIRDERGSRKRRTQP